MARLDRLIAGLVLGLATLGGLAIWGGALWLGWGVVPTGRELVAGAIIFAVLAGPLAVGWRGFARGQLMTATICGLSVLVLAVLTVRGVEGFLTFN